MQKLGFHSVLAKWILNAVVILSVALALGVGFATGSADGGQMTNPFFYDAQPPVMRSNARAGSALSVYFVSEAGTDFEEDTQWTVCAEGGDGAYQFRFYIGFVRKNGYITEMYDVHGYQAVTSDSEAVFRYRFVVPGEYQVWAFVTDGSGNEGSARFSHHIEEDGRMTTDQKVEQIVADCRAAGCTGDYETALWLHDWIIENASYDMSYSYYSADGVLIRGAGVCDSYSKAYVLLLEAAGMEVDRVTGGNHAWNVVRMDGDWYQVDPTWDDPVLSGYDQARSGFERHLYFGLPDALMQKDHSYTPDVSCVSYDANYYIRSGLVQRWAEPLKQDILDGLNGGCYAYDVYLPESYIDENGNTQSSGREIVFSLAAQTLSQIPEWDFGGQQLKLEFPCPVNGDALPVQIVFDGHVLSLPASLVSIEESAFYGDDVVWAVEIGEGATEIGASAFGACSGLWKVRIPDSVVSIHPSAFSDNAHVSIVCNDGSYAQVFAEECGYNCVIE